MALEPYATYRVSVSLRDRDNNLSSVGFNYPSANTIGNVEAELTGTVIPAIQALSDAVVVGWSINYGAGDNVAPLAPETSDVERKGVFTFRADNGQIVKFEIPSIRNTLVVDGTNVLNPADAGVIAFISAMTAAGVDGLQAVSNVGGLLLAQASPAKKMHRRSSKG